MNLSTDSPSSTNSSLSNPALQGATRFAVIGPAGLIAALALGAGAAVMARDAAKTGLFVLAASILGALLCAFAATRLTNYPARRLTWLLSAGALILSGVGSFLSAKSPSLPAIALSAIAALLLCFAFLGLARVTGAPHAAQPGEEAENQAAPFDWALAPDALVIGGAVSAIVWWFFLEPAQIAARMKGMATAAASPNGFHLVAFLLLAATALLVAGRREMHPGVQSASGPVLIPGWTIAWLSAFSGVLFGAIAALAHLRPGGAPQLLETFLSVAAPLLIATLALWEGFNLQSQTPAHVEAPLDARAARAFWLRNLAPLLCAGLAVIAAQIHFRGGAHYAKLGGWGELWWPALLILVALGRHAFDSLLNTRQTFEDYRSWNDLARGLQADVDARTRELSTLHEVAADLSNTLDSAKIIATALDRSINSLHADAGAVWLFKGEDEAETTLALTGTAGGDGFDSSAEARVERRKAQREGRTQETSNARGSATALRKALVEAALGQALAEHRDDWMPKGGRWHLVRTAGDSPTDRHGELQRNAIKSLHGGLEQGNIENALLACRSLSNNFQAAYIVPIQWKGEILGAFGILRSRGALSQAETALLQSLALEVGAALQNAYLYQEAVRLADRDSLSDLLNHRAVQQQLNVSLSRAARSRDQFVILMMDLNNFKFFNDTYGHQVGDEVIRRVAECLRQSCRISDVIGRYGGDEFIAILMDTDADGARIVVNRIEEKVAAQSLESDDGRRIPISLSFGGAIFPHDGEKGLELLGVADANVTEAKMAGGGFVMRSHAEESDELKALKDASVGGSFGVLDALVTAIDNKDNYTRRHSEDVARWGVMIGKQLGFTPEQQRSLRICGLLHDVGKIAVPDSVLRKPGRLNDDEFKVMQQHPVFGALIVKEVPDLDDVLGGIKHHHERFDGRGYPDRLPGLEIPLFGRILAVPDCFSAMTTNRPYRMGLSWDEAISEIVKGKGTQFDPDIADAFLRGIEELRKAESATEEAPAPAEETEPEVPLTPEELEKFGEGGYFMNIKPRSVLDAELEKAEQK